MRRRRQHNQLYQQHTNDYILQDPAGLLDDRRPGRVLEKEPENDGVGSTASVPTGKAESDGEASTGLSEPSEETRSVMNQQQTRAVAGRSFPRRA